MSLSAIAQHHGHVSNEPAISAYNGVLQDLQGSGSVTLQQAITSQLSISNGHAAHSDDTDKATEHDSLLDLFPLASDPSVVVALNGGSWFDSNTWSTGQIPANNQQVYIPMGVSVIYDSVSEAELDSVGIDGQLHFAVDVNTRIKVDTLITGSQSVLTIGDDSNPVQAGVKAEIIIHRTNGAISLNDDSSLLSKGIVTHGAVRLVGQDKTDHLKAFRHPQAGDDYLLFDTQPQHWQIGDKLVVAATHNDLSRTTMQFETYYDEVVTIESIQHLANGQTKVLLDQQLQFDHVPPSHSTAEELRVPVANYTRNIFIGAPVNGNYLGDGNTVPIAERGHIMFMHSDNVRIKNIEVFEMGRTDKSQFFSSTNISGRYSVHFHRTGVDVLSQPALISGSAIWGSPGWGIVHHDSNLNVIDNAVFGVVGSGIVAEAGNETGKWVGNIVIQTTGEVITFNAEQSADSNGNPPTSHPAYQAEVLNNSFMQGEAYGMKSRLLEITDNIAASTNGAGFSFWPHGSSGPSHIGAHSLNYRASQGYDPFYGQVSIYPGKVPTRDFHGNEVLASRHALNTSANKIAHRHDMDVIIEDLIAWNVDQPIMSFYQENYIVKDSIFIRGEGNTGSSRFYNDTSLAGDSSVRASAATHIHDAVDFKLINNHFEGYDVITKEPFQIIAGNTVVGSRITEETGPTGLYREGATADNDTIDILDNSANWRNNFANPIGHLTLSVDLATSDLVMTEWYDRFSIIVNKTDTIGSRSMAMGSSLEKEFRGASQKTWWLENAASYGYYRDSNNQIYLIVVMIYL